MIKQFIYQGKKNSNNLVSLLNFVQNNFDQDFYLTHQNERIYPSKLYQLKELFKHSSSSYCLEQNGDYVAFVLVWKSFGGDKKRYYVKLLAKDIKSASDVMRVLLWNTSSELHVKLNKRHPFLPVFKKNGFRFVGGRGRQILLCRDKIIQLKKESRVIEKEYFANSSNDSKE